MQIVFVASYGKYLYIIATVMNRADKVPVLMELY